LVGNGLRSSGVVHLLHDLARKTEIPVLTTMISTDLVQEDLQIGFIGVYGNRVSNAILSNCDLLISIGARLSLRQIGNKSEFFAPKADLIRVDIDPAELSRTIKDGEEKYLMDAKSFLMDLLSEDIPKYTAWKNKCFQAKELLKDYDVEIGNMAIKKISSLLPKNPIVAVDVGQNQCWSAQSLTLKGGKGRILMSGGYGSMGCGLPFAIGASIAEGYRRVYCITGDGGLQMNIQEFEAIVRDQIPVKVLVLNNYVLGKISEIQMESYQNRFVQTTRSSGYSVPDFSKIAEAYGIKSVTLRSFDLLDDYSGWMSDNEACLINILLPESTKLVPKMEWASREVLPKLDSSIFTEVLEVLA